jgi:hypothetical protein
MKKIILIPVLCFLSIAIYAQDEELISEEKSSAWVKITVPSNTSRVNTASRKTTTVNKKKTVVKPPASTPAAKPPDEFSNTNKKVNRFKKN